jgi:flagellar biosynthesis protein FlhF
VFIKKFEAPSLEQALSMVKNELGPNALILSTQNVKGKWFNKPGVEVTAAFEKGAGEAAAAESAKDSFSEEALLEVFPHRKRHRHVEEDVKATPTARKTPVNRYAEIAPSAPKVTANVTERNVETALLKMGLSSETAADIARQLAFDYPKKDLAIASFLDKAISRALVGSMTTLDAGVFEHKPRWTVVGISGAGKTSALVKLALHLKTSGKSVGLASFDKQKLLGRRELSSYAKLIHVPFADGNHGTKASSIELCDSPAFPLGETHAPAFSEVERSCTERSVLLVIDASMRLKEALRVVENVTAKVPVTALAFTRLDLISQAGIMYDVLRRSRLPLLGASISSSFKVGFKFFEPMELANYILRPRNNG